MYSLFKLNGFKLTNYKKDLIRSEVIGSYKSLMEISMFISKNGYWKKINYNINVKNEINDYINIKHYPAAYICVDENITFVIVNLNHWEFTDAIYEELKIHIRNNKINQIILS